MNKYNRIPVEKWFVCYPVGENKFAWVSEVFIPENSNYTGMEARIIHEVEPSQSGFLLQKPTTEYIRNRKVFDSEEEAQTIANELNKNALIPYIVKKLETFFY